MHFKNRQIQFILLLVVVWIVSLRAIVIKSLFIVIITIATAIIIFY